MNLIDGVLLGLIVMTVILALRQLRRKGHGCCGNCSSCRNNCNK